MALPALSVKPSVLVGAIGVAIVFLVGYNWIYVPGRKQVGVIRAQIAQEQLRQRTAAEINTLLQEVERYRKRLPPEPAPSWLVRELRPLAEGANVQLIRIAQEPPRTLSQATRLAVSLDIVASYHQLGAFLDAVERSERFIQVEQIAFHATNAKRGEAPSMTVRFSTLSLTPPTAS